MPEKNIAVAANIIAKSWTGQQTAGANAARASTEGRIPIDPATRGGTSTPDPPLIAGGPGIMGGTSEEDIEKK